MNQPQGVGFKRLERFVADPPKALWTLSLPIIFGMSIQTLYMVVDMIFVGRLGADALTALAFNLPLSFLAMGATFGLGSGVTALVAQAIGSRDQRRADGVAGHAIMLGIILTFGFTSAGLIWGPDILRLIGVPANLQELAWDYLQVSAAGYCFLVSGVFFRSILNGEGEVKKPVMIQAGGTLLNIALDPVFIFTLGLGVRGAALATLASQSLVASALFYLLFIQKKNQVRPRLKGFRWQRQIIEGLLKIGVPASLSFVVMALGGGLFNRILVEFSADAVAAHQIGGRLDHVVVLPIVAISHSLVTLVGMFYGARRFDLVRSIIRYAVVRAVGIGVSISVVFFIFAPELAAIFSDDPEVRRFTVLYTRTLAFAYPFFPISMVTGRCLQALGHGAPELILSLTRVILIAVPLACAFVFWLGLPVHWVWIAIVTASCTSAAIAAIWLRLGLRRALAEA